MVVICGGYGRGKVSRWKTKLNLKNDQKPKQPIVSNKSRLVSFAGQVTGFLGPKACASLSNVRAQCLYPSYPEVNIEKITRKENRIYLGMRQLVKQRLSTERCQKKNLTYLRERLCVWNFQAAHAVLVSLFLKVLFVGSSAPVTIISTNLTRELDVQAVQFVEPVRDGFAVET